MVAEPDLEERRGMRGYIGGQGLENQAGATIEEAVNLPAGESWDVVFLVPQSVSGTLQEIARLRETGPDPRIVLMIESGRTADALAVLDAGPIIALRKPVSETDVASILALVSS